RPARRSLGSDRSNPRGSTRCSVAPVTAANRMALPVFPAIRGSKNITWSTDRVCHCGPSVRRLRPSMTHGGETAWLAEMPDAATNVAFMTSPYVAAADRYESMSYRRTGRSGLDLPALSLGLWQNFGTARAYEDQRAIILRAFDLGITHIDLANNYGPPIGAAEETFGRVLAQDLRRYRDEIVVSTKAGYVMQDGPYGTGGSRKYLLSSLDRSLERTGLDF